MSYDPYLQGNYRGSSISDDRAARQAQEAASTLGREQVSRQMQEARQAGERQTMELPGQLAGQAAYVRQQHAAHASAGYSSAPVHSSPPFQGNSTSQKQDELEPEIDDDAPDWVRAARLQHAEAVRAGRRRQRRQDQARDRSAEKAKAQRKKEEAELKRRKQILHEQRCGPNLPITLPANPAAIAVEVIGLAIYQFFGVLVGRYAFSRDVLFDSAWLNALLMVTFIALPITALFSIKSSYPKAVWLIGPSVVLLSSLDINIDNWYVPSIALLASVGSFTYTFIDVGNMYNKLGVRTRWRESLFRRRLRCDICDQRLATDFYLIVDPIQGGAFNDQNVVLTCANCRESKQSPVEKEKRDLNAIELK